jgi:hypothetical protein
LDTSAVEEISLGTSAPFTKLFGLLKQRLRYSPIHNNDEVVMVIREGLRMQEPDFYCEGIPYAQTRKMHQRALRLCSKIVIILWNK